jgi:hypothetical protein
VPGFANWNCLHNRHNDPVILDRDWLAGQAQMAVDALLHEPDVQRIV